MGQCDKLEQNMSPYGLVKSHNTTGNTCMACHRSFR